MITQSTIDKNDDAQLDHKYKTKTKEQTKKKENQILPILEI